MAGIGQSGPAFARRRATTIAELPTDYRPSQAGVVMVSVKAQNGAVVYGSGSPAAVATQIGEDDYQLVELDATIGQAILDGDLVKDPAHPKPELMQEQIGHAGGPRKRMRHVKTTEANPMPEQATVEPRQPQLQRPPRQPVPPRQPRTPPAAE